MILHHRIQQAMEAKLEKLAPPAYGHVSLLVQVDYQEGAYTGHTIDVHAKETFRN